MKFIAAICSLLLAIPVWSAPNDIALCQVQMLKRASAVVEANFGASATNVMFFKEISFNYSDRDKPKVVYFGESLNGNPRYCLVQVMFAMPDMSHTRCDSLQIINLDSTCP